MSHTKKYRNIISVLTLIWTLTTSLASAQNATQNSTSGAYIGIIPSVSVTDNQFPTTISTPSHPPISLSPDKSELIALDSAATTIIIGNPNHLSILPSTSQGLILVGRIPGATHFIALNKDNEIIMQRHVFVAAPKDNYIRIRKTCATSDDANCQKMQVYYCPDTCHEIVTNTNTENSDTSAAAPLGAPSQAQIETALPPEAIDSATE